MKLFAVIFIALLSVFIFPINSGAQYGAASLNKAVSHFAKRQVTVKCRTEEEDSLMVWMWGYVIKPTSEQNHTVVASDACIGALAIDKDLTDVSDYYKVIGASTLIHEAFHLKKIKFNDNEAVTECRAMRNYDLMLLELGAESATIQRLMPLLLLENYVLMVANPQYYLSNCKYPERYAQYGITNP